MARERMFTPRNVLCIGASGAALALCFAAGEADANYRDGTFYVHRKAVTMQKVGQICCDPTVTFYDVFWGKTKQATIHWNCAHPHAIVAGVEPAKNQPRNRHRARAWFIGCQGTAAQAVRFLRLRD